MYRSTKIIPRVEISQPMVEKLFSTIMMMNYVFWTLLKFEYSNLSAFSWKLISNNECDRRDSEGGEGCHPGGHTEREMAMIDFIMIFVIMGGTTYLLSSHYQLYLYHSWSSHIKFIRTSSLSLQLNTICIKKLSLGEGEEGLQMSAAPGLILSD